MVSDLLSPAAEGHSTAIYFNQVLLECSWFPELRYQIDSRSCPQVSLRHWKEIHMNARNLNIQAYSSSLE